jgi:lysophospholipase L1-like esterase
MPYHYLALGDSYTIGEAVPLVESFPYQTVQTLRKQNLFMAAPEVIAKTGWTTGELTAAMDAYQFAESYDVVSLLIGVNNQYRGYPVEDYKRELKHLLERALQLASGKKENIFVLSIPDYSITPFAQTLDKTGIAKEIDAFNAAKLALCHALNIAFINITESTRRAEKNVHLLAADGLHPSAAEYRTWALQLASNVKSVLP